MTKLARLFLGLLAAAVVIAAPIPARARAVAPVAPAVAGRFARASATDPSTLGIFHWHLENPHPCVRDSKQVSLDRFG